MNSSFYIGAMGLRSEQAALDVIASNIANVNTPGFKRTQVRFSELISAPAAETAVAVQTGQVGLSGVLADTSGRVFTQGELRPTGKDTDFAIRGEGFIELLGPNGDTVLWRGGALKINGDGSLAAANGMPLKSQIAVPAGVASVSLAPDGEVTATPPGEAAPVTLGHIELVLARGADLQAVGEGLYQAANQGDLISATPGEDGAGLLVQGSLENSNVELSEEMVTLMLIQRAYAANAQVLQAGDQLMAIANELKR